jgi:hypothetical protein
MKNVVTQEYLRVTVIEIREKAPEMLTRSGYSLFVKLFSFI